MARPLVGHRELRLDRRILLTEFRETRPHPFQRRLSRQPFAGRSGAGRKAPRSSSASRAIGIRSTSAAIVIELAKQSPTFGQTNVNKLNPASLDFHG